MKLLERPRSTLGISSVTNFLSEASSTVPGAAFDAGQPPWHGHGFPLS